MVRVICNVEPVTADASGRQGYANIQVGMLRGLLHERKLHDHSAANENGAELAQPCQLGVRFPLCLSRVRSHM